MKQDKIILIAGAGIALYFLMKSNSAAALPNQTGLPISSQLSTAQMVQAINSWWETTTPAGTQASDNGRFEDIISSLDPASVANVYAYITQYVMQGTRPPSGSALQVAISNLSTEYGIFNN